MCLGGLYESRYAPENKGLRVYAHSPIYLRVRIVLSLTY